MARRFPFTATHLKIAVVGIQLVLFVYLCAIEALWVLVVYFGALALGITAFIVIRRVVRELRSLMGKGP